MASKMISAKATKVATLLVVALGIMLLSPAAAVVPKDPLTCASNDWAAQQCCTSGRSNGLVKSCLACLVSNNAGSNTQWACTQCLSRTNDNTLAAACFINLDAAGGANNAEWGALTICTDSKLVKSADESVQCGICTASDKGTNAWACGQCLTNAKDNKKINSNGGNVKQLGQACMTCVQASPDKQYQCNECAKLQSTNRDEFVKCFNAINPRPIA